MAMVSPYGDPNAHGPINSTFCFQRYKKKVFMRTLPRPVSRRTANQIIQRQKLSGAAKAYSLLTGDSKYYYRKRASQKSKTGLNLFMSGHMKSYLPSILYPIPAKSIESIVVFNPAGLYSDEILISIVAYPGPAPVSCVAWWKLENLLAEIGIDWTEAGTVEWRDCKFLKGVWNNSISNYLSLAENFFDPNQFIYTCWFKTDYAVINGVAQDASPYHGFFAWWKNNTNLVYIDFHSTNGLYNLFKIGGVNTSYICTDAALTFNAGTLHPIIFVHNQTGIAGGTDKYRIYFDGALIFNSTVAANNQTNTGATMYQNIIRGAVAIAYPFMGTIDNAKIYNDTAQETLDDIIANMENESWLLTQAEYGYIYDSENIYTKVDEVLDLEYQKIIITTPSGHPCHIPFRYLMRVEWKDQTDEVFNSVIRLPEIILGEGESLTLYLSRDWSVYYDKNFHRLACTNQL